MSDAHKLEGYPKGIIKLGFFFRVYLFDLSYCTVRISYLPDDFQHFTVKITFEPTNYLALSSWPPKMHGIEIFSKL